MRKLPSTFVLSAILANLVIFSVLVWAVLAESYSADFYFQSLQEDGLLEWMTFWAFLLGCIAFMRSVTITWKADHRILWFEISLALFCFFVAMEEISWAQRLIGFSAPQYFLANNFQQEFNFHNTVSIVLRELTLLGVILGYGVILPLLNLVPGLKQRFARFGISVPSLLLLPSFAVIIITHLVYPMRFSGELVELMLGLCFLFVSIGFGNGGTPNALRIIVSALLVCFFGLASAAVSMAMVKAAPAALEATRVESRALARDFQNLARAGGGVRATRCGVHMRVFSYMQKHYLYDLQAGEFSELQKQGLSEVRASFFIDLWGGAFWINHNCTQDGLRQTAFVYSFGPNRRRDSNEWEILGDDIGAAFVEIGKKQ